MHLLNHTVTWFYILQTYLHVPMYMYIVALCDKVDNYTVLIMLCNWLKELLQSQINCLQLYIVIYSPQAKMQKPTFQLSLPKGQ